MDTKTAEQFTEVTRIQDFSIRLFWDVDPVSLDIDRDKKYVIARVLEFGTLQDWRRLVAQYTLDGIIAAAKTLRTLDAKALSFLCVVGHVPKEAFRCYALKQSNPTPWNS